eukprot:scaffold187331_cov63-Attheya_sp.AAC.5
MTANIITTTGRGTVLYQKSLNLFKLLQASLKLLQASSSFSQASSSFSKNRAPLNTDINFLVDVPRRCLHHD